MGQISPQWAISLLQQSNPLIAAYPHCVTIEGERSCKDQMILIGISADFEALKDLQGKSKEQRNEAVSLRQWETTDLFKDCESKDMVPQFIFYALTLLNGSDDDRQQVDAKAKCPPRSK